MKSLLPPNASRVERLIEEVFAERLELIGDAIADSGDPATCPANLLPWLAWARSVDVWRPTWSERTKRAVIAASLIVHRQRGTVAAVKAALNAMDARVELLEWFKTGGAPFTATARIYASGPGGAPQLGPELLADLRAAADLAAPARARIAYQFGVTVPKVLRPRAALAGHVERASLSLGTVRQTLPPPNPVTPAAAAVGAVERLAQLTSLTRQSAPGARTSIAGGAVTRPVIIATLAAPAAEQAPAGGRPRPVAAMTRPMIRARVGAPHLEAA